MIILVDYAQTAAVGSVSLIGSAGYTECSGRSGRLSSIVKVVYSLAFFFFSIRCQNITNYAICRFFASQKSEYFWCTWAPKGQQSDRLEAQSFEYVWTRAAVQPKEPTSHVLCAQPQPTLVKAGLRWLGRKPTIELWKIIGKSRVFSIAFFWCSMGLTPRNPKGHSIRCGKMCLTIFCVSVLLLMVWGGLGKRQRATKYVPDRYLHV